MNVKITVDGQELDLNEFVQRITFNIASGVVESLRDVPEWSKVEIKIEK